MPEKPVRSLTVHCLFRGHTGQVWFDDLAVEEIRAEGSAVLFQGVPVRTGRLSRGIANLRHPLQSARMILRAVFAATLLALGGAASAQRLPLIRPAR